MQGFGSSEAGRKGGKSRAEKLTKAERSEIARSAAQARWVKEGKAKEVPVATHGSPDHPLRIGDGEDAIEIPCYVLDDERRVLMQRGMMSGLDMSQGTAGRGAGDRLAKFIAGKSLSQFVSNDLRDVITKPILFRTQAGGQAYGYEATVLADLCDVVLKARADGKLNYQQEHIAKRCEILVRGFARVGINALVDEATGFQEVRARDSLAKILEAFVAKELKKWVKTFPSDFYKELFRLRRIPFNGTCKKPGYIGHLTNDLIYSRLAPGVLIELRRKNPRLESGRRKSKHHQWLTEDTGHPALRQHLHAVTALMKVSDAWDSFYVMLDKAFKPYKELPLFKMMGVDPDE